MSSDGLPRQDGWEEGDEGDEGDELLSEDDADADELSDEDNADGWLVDDGETPEGATAEAAELGGAKTARREPILHLCASLSDGGVPTEAARLALSACAVQLLPEMLQPGELAPSLDDDVAAADGGAAAAAAGAGADGGLGVATGGGGRGGGGVRGPSTKAVVDGEMPRLARMVHRSREGISKMIDAFLDSTPEGTPPASKAQIRVAISAIAEYAQPAGAPKSAAKCWIVHAEKLKELGLYEELETTRDNKGAQIRQELETTPVAMAPIAQQPAAPIGKPLLAGLQLAAAQAAAMAQAAAAAQEQAQAQDQAAAVAQVQVSAAPAGFAVAPSAAASAAPASVANPAVKNNFMRSFLTKSADKGGKELPRMSEDAPTKEDKEDAYMEDPPAGPLGTILWAKQAGYVYWPAIVAREAQGPDRHKRDGGWTFVRYFGTNQIGYCKLTMPWAEGKEKCLKEAEEAQKKKPASVRGFKQGVEEAEAEIAKNNFMRSLLPKSNGKGGSSADVPTSAPADSSPAPPSAVSSGSSALETPALTAAPHSFGPPDGSGGSGGGSGSGSGDGSSGGSSGGSGGEGSDLEVVKTLFGSGAVATSAARTPMAAAEGANEVCTPMTDHADCMLIAC